MTVFLHFYPPIHPLLKNHNFSHPPERHTIRTSSNCQHNFFYLHHCSVATIQHCLHISSKSIQLTVLQLHVKLIQKFRTNNNQYYHYRISVLSRTLHCQCQHYRNIPGSVTDRCPFLLQLCLLPVVLSLATHNRDRK